MHETGAQAGAPDDPDGWDGGSWEGGSGWGTAVYDSVDSSQCIAKITTIL